MASHALTARDTDQRIGTCVTCGPGTRIRPRTTKAGGVTWVCRGNGRGDVVAQRARHRDRHGGRPRPAPDPEVKRRSRLRGDWGLTVEEYEQQVTAQGGLCAICRRPPGALRLAVDHCHRSGRRRELLCTSCNTGLGLFGEDAARLRAALTYLEKHEAPPAPEQRR